MKKLILLFVTVALILLSCEYPEIEDEDDVYDSIYIFQVTPNTGLTYESPTVFDIKIKYELLTKAQGRIQVYFNDGDTPNVLMPAGYGCDIVKGAGELTFYETAKPKNWAAPNKFKVAVIMDPIPSGNVGLAYDEKPLN